MSSGILSSLQLEASKPRPQGVQGLQQPITDSSDVNFLKDTVGAGLGAFSAVSDIRAKRRQEGRVSRESQQRVAASKQKAKFDTLEALQDIGDKAFSVGGMDGEGGVNQLLESLQKSDMGTSIRPVLEFMFENDIRPSFGSKGTTGGGATLADSQGRAYRMNEDGEYKLLSVKGEDGEESLYKYVQPDLIKSRAEAKIDPAVKQTLKKGEVTKSQNFIDSNDGAIFDADTGIALLQKGESFSDNAARLKIASALNKGRPSDKDLQFLTGNKSVKNTLERIREVIMTGKITELDREEIISALETFKSVARMDNNRRRLRLSKIDDGQLSLIRPIGPNNIIAKFDRINDYENSGLEGILEKNYKGGTIIVGDDMWSL